MRTIWGADKTEAPNWEMGEAPGDIQLRGVKYVGRHTSRGLLRFRHFIGADWGGKCVGMSNKTWMTALLTSDDNESFVESISRVG